MMVFDESGQRKKVRRIFCGEEKGYDVEARGSAGDLKSSLDLSGLEQVRNYQQV